MPVSNDSWGHDSRSILIVEDPMVRRLVYAMLAKRGYPAIETDPATALDLLRTSPASISLVVTNTPDVFLRYAETVPFLYLAACPDYTLAESFHSCTVVAKPFHPATLMDAVADLLVSA